MPNLAFSSPSRLYDAQRVCSSFVQTILARENNGFFPCLAFCIGERSSTRSIDLSSVAGVTAHQSESLWHCGWSADDIVVSVNMELGLPPVPPLRVQKGTGWQGAQIIREAVDALHAPTSASTPTPQAMNRGPDGWRGASGSASKGML